MKNKIIKCKCGCGETFNKFDKWYRERKYLPGHYHRKSTSLQRKPSEQNPIIKCACGCGKTFFKYDKHGRPRMYIHGHQTTFKTIEEVFWKNVKKTDSCWLWTGSKQKAGYGDFGHRCKHYLAHRVSWEIHNGKIKNGLFVLHKCDNPSCVNPEHLFLGTQVDNMHDAHNKNRIRHCSKTGKFLALNM